MNTKEHAIEPVRDRMKAYIRALIPSLVPSEATVARALLEHADDITGWSAGRLAAATGTSPATVIRACQSLGYTGLSAIENLDYPVITGVVIVAALIAVLANTVVDLLHAVLDPRLRRLSTV